MKDRELKLTYKILKSISESNTPLGASILSLKLKEPQATIGRILQKLEYEGYLQKSSNKGRTLTEKGKEYLNSLMDNIDIMQGTEELIKVSSSLDKELLLDVLYTRRILEKETAFLAAKKITDEELLDLERIVNMQESEKLKGGIGEKEDLQFHKMIARISGNKVIEQILTLILTQNNVYVKLSFINKMAMARPDVTAHRRIIQALKKRNPELAAEAMVNHLNNIINDVKKYY